MTDILKARDSKDVEEAVRWALAEGKALEIVALGSKRAIGRPAQSDLTLDLSALSGVTLYEPEELVLSANAGTPLAEVEALVAGKGQMLAFEPMDCGPIFGGASSGSIGGALATNLCGPRRIKAGAARDHFLGVTAVSGRGETFKAGGRVIKNVTGYDLCKLLAGSWGTLAVMTEVTLKVLPRPESEQTVCLIGLDDAAAVQAMAAAINSAADVSAAAHLPAAIVRRLPASLSNERAMTLLRLEGVAASIPHRTQLLAEVLAPHGLISLLPEVDSRTLWRAVRDATPLAADERALWRISTMPTRGHEVATRIAAATDATYFLDWAGGLVWIAVPATEDAGAMLVGEAVAKAGGHATLIRAPAAARAAVDVFHRQDAGVTALTKRVKTAFDPKGVLNPGRMYAGV